MSPSHRPHFTAVVTGWMALLTFATPHSAQTIDRPPSDGLRPNTGTATEAKPVKMSVFEVTGDKDVGYQGGNSTAGSRFNTSLQDTAAAIMVVTPEFISDFGGNSLESLTAYGANLEVDFLENRSSPNPGFLGGSDYSNPRIRVRGLSASPAMDFFDTTVIIDNYNIERFEISSGPNSILFGLGSPGGLLNASTKKADFLRRRTALRTQFGDWDFSRYELDHNQVIVPGRLAVRLNALHQNSGGWRKWDFSDSKRAAVSLRYSPTQNTGFVVNYENGDVKSHVSRPLNADDAVLLWQASGARTMNDSAWTTADRALGINRNTTVRNLYVTDANGSTPFVLATSNVANFRLLDSAFDNLNLPAAQRAGRTLVPAAKLPFEYSAYGPGAGRDLHFDRYYVTGTQRFTENAMLEVSYNKEKPIMGVMAPQNQQLTLGGDPNATIPNPNGNGTLVANPNAGRLYLNALWGTDRGLQTNEAYRAALSWKVGLGKFGTHHLAAMVEHGTQRKFRYVGREILIDDDGVPISNAAVPENANNFVTRRHYVAAGDFNTYIGGDATQPVTVTRNGKRYHSEWINQSTNGRDINRATDTALAVTQSHFFDSKLVVTAGLRSDQVTYDQHGSGRVSPSDPAVLAHRVVANTLTFTPEITDSFVYEPISWTTGAVYHATRWFSAFYNHANNTDQPSYNQSILPDEILPPPAEGKTHDYGFMLRLLDGKFFLRATAFKTSQIQTTGGIGLAAAVTQPSTRILDTLLENNRISAADYRQHLVGDQGTLIATEDLVNQGYEVSASLNLSRNFTALLNFSHTKTDHASIGREFEKWYERELAYWNRTPGAGRLVNGTLGTSIDQDAAEMPRLIRELREFNSFGWGERPDKANASGRTTFSEGRLKGVFAGGGVRWRSTSKLGRRVVGIAANGSTLYGETFIGPEDFKVDAFLGYRRQIAIARTKPQLTVQVNVANLTNEDSFMPLRYNADYSGYSNVLLLDPRSIRLTVALVF